MQHRTWELELNHQMSWKRGPRVEPSRPFGYKLGCFVLCVLLSFSNWPCLPVALPPRWALLSSTGPASSSSTVSAYQWLFFVDLVLELSPSPVPLPTISWTISWTIPETDPKVTFTSIVLRKVGSIDWVDHLQPNDQVRAPWHVQQSRPALAIAMVFKKDAARADVIVAAAPAVAAAATATAAAAHT